MARTRRKTTATKPGPRGARAKTQGARKTAARKAGGARKAAKSAKAQARRPAAKRTGGRAGVKKKTAARAAKTATRPPKAPARAMRAAAKPSRKAAAATPRRKPAGPAPARPSARGATGARPARLPRLDRERKVLRELEDDVPTPPSSLDLDRSASAVRSGRQRLQDAREDHTETSPVLTGGDVDADWQDAYAVGDEAPGGDNPTPDQDRVDDIGKALGVTYDDNEELKASDKIADRDRHRWELDPASSEDYTDRD